MMRYYSIYFRENDVALHNSHVNDALLVFDLIARKTIRSINTLSGRNFLIEL